MSKRPKTSNDTECSSCHLRLDTTSIGTSSWTIDCCHILCARCVTPLFPSSCEKICPVCSKKTNSITHSWCEEKRGRIKHQSEKISLLPKKEEGDVLVLANHEGCSSISLSNIAPENESVLFSIARSLHEKLVPNRKMSKRHVRRDPRRERERQKRHKAVQTEENQ